MRDEEDIKGGEVVGAILVAALIITSIFVVIAIATNSPTQLEQTIEQYNEAVELCDGEDNVHEINYTNGKTDFDCYTYVAKE